jgi:mannose-1-phosphate guanylyltransferase/mannose-6-phosphate isomerase
VSNIIYPIILCGGSGTRLWPLSRQLYPKQFLSLGGARSLLGETIERVSGDDFAAPLFICNEKHRFIVAEHARRSAGGGAIMLEPAGRNTAPAAAAAALMVMDDDKDALIMLLPSDHMIENRATFTAAVATAATAAHHGALVTFGITPTAANTGYGYIRRGAAMENVSGCFAVESFKEKPDAATAKSYLDAGGYFWNSGMFLFSAKRYLEELERFSPDMLALCRKAVGEGSRESDFFRLETESFTAVQSLSIDCAVMERTAAAVVVPADMGWSDVGSWSALWDLGEKDAAGNVAVGNVLLRGAETSYVHSSGPLVAALGVKDIAVIATDDAVLVLPRDDGEKVKEVVEILKDQERPEYASHLTVYRFWGSYRTLKVGDRFLINYITLKPGALIPLQRHRHRAEHWVVVGGTARVTRDGETFDLTEDQSAYIPIGAKHRLENPFDEELHIVEVQSGAILAKDDIERFADAYGRA